MSLVRTKVAVLRGGGQPAYEESLKTGNFVLNLLREKPEEYEPMDIFISREGDWHHQGVVSDPYELLTKAHVVWNGLHSPGEHHKALESLKVPYIGSNLFSSNISHNKDLAKEIYIKHGIRTPDYSVVTSPDDELILIKTFKSKMPPFIVKPATGVRGIGIRIAHTFKELKEAVQKAFAHSPKVLVEEYVRGVVVTCGVVEGGRGQDLHALVPMHIETDLKRVRPKPEDLKKVEDLAKLAHQVLGLRHFSSSDFIITPRSNIYILETNSSPLFHDDSIFHQSLNASGWKPQDFLEHCLNLALNKI